MMVYEYITGYIVMVLGLQQTRNDEGGPAKKDPSTFHEHPPTSKAPFPS